MELPIKDIDPRCPHLDYLYNLFDGYRSTLVIYAAANLELFDILDACSQPSTSEELAIQQGWDADNTERILKSLVALTVVRLDRNAQNQEVYTVADIGQSLIRNKPGSFWGLIARFVPGIGQSMAKLAEEVKTGKNKTVSHPHQVTVHKPKDHSRGQSHSHGSQAQGHGHVEGHVGGASMTMLDRYRAMESSLRACAPTMVTAFDLTQYKSAVDLGGGSGAAAYALARSYPGMAVTIFEVPPVIAVIKEHFLPKETDIQVSLCEGGAVMLFEKCLNNDKVGPISANMFDMTVMSFCAGRQRSFQEYASLLEKNGFHDVQFARTTKDCIFDIIYAKKR